ncbi:ATP-binding protein [Streptomyces mesophilus]|uniref:ATP-binding protein n=1 Tax=Streptomyces mesophilus TaxID=1775132 RepID=UPI003330B209
MTFAFSDAESCHGLADRLSHVRWIAGGAGSGKSTLARLLADRYDVEIYCGDRAEHAWLERCTPQLHPRLASLRGLAPGAMWRERTGRQVFQEMPSLYGETIGFLVEDLLERPDERIILVDYFGTLPRDLAPLLRRPEQAVFLVPTPEFRHDALSARYADRARAQANWGGEDPASTLAERLARDALWDEEVRRQAPVHGLAALTVDGSTPASVLADRIALRFELGDHHPR